MRSGHPHLLQTLSTTGLLSENCDGSHFAVSVQEPRVDTDSYVAPDGSEYINIPRLSNGRSILDKEMPQNGRISMLSATGMERRPLPDPSSSDDATTPLALGKYMK